MKHVNALTWDLDGIGHLSNRKARLVCRCRRLSVARRLVVLFRQADAVTPSETAVAVTGFSS